MAPTRTGSALDTPDIAGGENIGTVDVFDGPHLDFTETFWFAWVAFHPDAEVTNPETRCALIEAQP